MSEQELRDGLAALVVDEPPLNFDPDALMANADAAARRRRTLVGVSGATVVIAAAAVALPITLRGVGNPNAQTTPGAVVTTTAGAPGFVWPPAHNKVPALTVEQVEQTAHKLQTEARRAFPRAVPTATEVGVDLFAGEAEGDYHAGQLNLNGAVHFATAQGRAAVDIEVNAGASTPSPGKTCVHESDATCKIMPQQDGTVLVVTRWGQDQLQVLTVRHFRPDGVVVAVSGYNADTFLPKPTPYLPRIPVTEKQLVALATDKGLTM
ncbi:hypothetical protein [Labedaea rhizosphaerae]|uniref:Uncharacterized protein n=1 Tax=Labedaea rhizosphaerae TaxID=598644 RepID=A0A4R6SN30_LABRH|nr:hypothetical protein [Labedaea rhizosphaerae]TDQ05384.1 hypothetical protein EV186_1011354 [Labedaea rhizosphaerae]